MIKSIFSIVWMDLKKLAKSPKCYLLLFFTFYFLQEFSQSYVDVIHSSGLAVTPFFYPVFYGDWSNRLYAMIIIIMLFSDAPYIGKEIKFTVLRAGRVNWAVSRIIYTIVLAAGNQLALFVLSILVFLPNVGFHNEWGFVIETVAKGFTQDMTGKGNLEDFESIIAGYSPISALLYNMLIVILFSIAIGLVILILNGIFGNGTGALLAIVLATADHFLSMMQSANIINIKWLNECRYVHIMSWMNLSNLSLEHMTGKMQISYLVFGLLLSSILLSIVFIILVKKRVIRAGE